MLASLRYLKIITVFVVLFTASSALAGPYTDALSVCLADNTTGKERKELARWIFVAMAAHPEIKGMTTITDADRDQTSRFMGSLLTRLVSESCPSQTRAAVENEGSESLKNAFGVLGKLAINEIMSNKEVNATIVAFEKYLDQKKIEAALKPK
jgi:hypothetical protein